MRQIASKRGDAKRARAQSSFGDAIICCGNRKLRVGARWMCDMLDRLGDREMQEQLRNRGAHRRAQRYNDREPAREPRGAAEVLLIKLPL